MNMNGTFVCKVSEKESKELLDIFEMKNTLESLIRQIAADNDILKEDSQLYSRLVEDYRKSLGEYNRAWSPYLEKYKDLLDDNTQLTMDFRTREIFLTSKQNSVEVTNG